MFQGFSDATIDFMWGIRLNNERDWFLSHKQQYEDSLNTPMKELGRELFERMHAAYPQQAFLSKVTRIYRDTRRLHGRGPYKDHLWISLRPPGENWMDAPSFWFSLLPDGWCYGLGMYCGKAGTATKLRARLDRDPKPMEELTRRLNKQKEFVLDGPEYARAKSCSSPLLYPWYQKKYYSLIHQEEISPVLYSRDLLERVFTGWQFLMPFYLYFQSIASEGE